MKEKRIGDYSWKLYRKETEISETFIELKAEDLI